MRFLDASPAIPRRIAVIGAGIAGLSAAWLLSQRHRVTLYSRDAWLGGHACTVDVPMPGGDSVPVDTGFIVYNEPNYPNLTALFAHLGVPTEASDMSFSASVGGGRLEYSSAGLNQYLGQRRNLLRPRFWRLTRDLFRFYGAAAKLAADPAFDPGAMTLGDYLDRERYSTTFAADHILPISAAIWSTSPAAIRDYPLGSFLRFFFSHGLLNIFERPRWRTVSGGSREYVRRMLPAIAETRAATPVARIHRSPGYVAVEDAAGRTDRFDDVVIATHADQALKLLAEPDAAERRILGAFSYTANRAILHRDPRLMPRTRRVWSSWNFIDAGPGDLSLTYWMNQLQNLHGTGPLFVSLNPQREPAPGATIAEFDYDHPLFDRAALAAQPELGSLQGNHRTWFCGAHFGYGFHEDGIQSGLAVAEALGGVNRPWVPARADRIAAAVGPQLVPEIAA